MQTDPRVLAIDIVPRQCSFKQICFFLRTIQNFLYRLVNKPKPRLYLCQLMLLLPLGAYGPTEKLKFTFATSQGDGKELAVASHLKN